MQLVLYPIACPLVSLLLLQSLLPTFASSVFSEVYCAVGEGLQHDSSITNVHLPTRTKARPLRSSEARSQSSTPIKHICLTVQTHFVLFETIVSSPIWLEIQIPRNPAVYSSITPPPNQDFGPHMALGLCFPVSHPHALGATCARRYWCIWNILKYLSGVITPAGSQNYFLVPRYGLFPMCNACNVYDTAVLWSAPR